MKIKEVMSRDVATCRPSDSVATAATRMWDRDCGALPVVEDGRVRGMITDRDICIALVFKGREPWAVDVGEVVNGPLFSCSPETDVAEALEVMRDHQVRRLPVLDDGRLAGVVSLSDLALAAGEGKGTEQGPSCREVVDALQGICTHHRPAVAA